MTTRRLVLARSAALLGATSTGLLTPSFAQSGKVRIGLMLPYTGTFAQLGIACDNGFRMALQEVGNKLGGREVEFFKSMTNPNPPRALRMPPNWCSVTKSTC